MIPGGQKLLLLGTEGQGHVQILMKPKGMKSNARSELLNEQSLCNTFHSDPNAYICQVKAKDIGPLEKEDGSFMSNDLETIDNLLTF